MAEHNEQHAGSREHGEHQGHPEHKEHEHEEHKELHIFVNRRKFHRGDGVKQEMTGAQIAALVGVPATNAVVREEEPHKREIGVTEAVHVKNGEHFLVTRKVVEGGYVARERILRELEVLREGKQVVDLVTTNHDYVVYRDVPTAGARVGAPPVTDVIVPVPLGYPGSPIDLAGLPIDSPLLNRVKGGKNNQGVVQAAGKTWRLASYHPHQNGGGGPWDQMKHGFHTYLDHLLSWLEQVA